MATLNVVFDLGGVVVICSPPELVSSLFDDPAVQKAILEGVFGDSDWRDFDRGTLPRETAIERAAERTGIARPDMRALFDALPEALVPVPAVLAIVRDLRASGHRLFVLSNMHRGSLAHLETAHDIFELFEGRVVSCEVGLVKPEPEIYAWLLNAFALEAGETVLIDDVEANLCVAAAHGMRTIRFEDPEQCRAELVDLGCL